MKDQVARYRQELHRIPELGFELNKTRAYILDILHRYRCEITEVSGGICAFFHSGRADEKHANNGYTIALRCDMDALPITEETGLPCSSEHPGVMHACGHDGHMAMLLAVAGELESMISTLPHNVMLIFQPAEETTGGACNICDSGILQKHHVKRIYGFHLWPMLEKNVIASRANEFMAKASDIDIIIEGKSSHCASANQGIDALAIGCEMVIELYRMAEHELPPSEYRLLKFGRLESGTVRNAISDKTVLEGSVRCFHDDIGDFLFRRIDEITSSMEEKYGCRIRMERSDGHPAVINDPYLFEETKALLSDYDFLTFEKPFMQAEDFSCYQQIVPGLFLFLGTGTEVPLHNNRFDFDENVLQTGVDIYLKLLKDVRL